MNEEVKTTMRHLHRVIAGFREALFPPHHHNPIAGLTKSYRMKSPATDRKRLDADWIVVGHDMRGGVNRYERESGFAETSWDGGREEARGY